MPFYGGVSRSSIVQWLIRDFKLRDRAAFLRLGALNEMPKAFLERAVGASVLGGSGGMLPREIFKLNASKMLKIHPNIADTVNSFIIYQANKHQIWTKITKHQTQGKFQQLLLARWQI